MSSTNSYVEGKHCTRLLGIHVSCTLCYMECYGRKKAFGTNHASKTDQEQAVVFPMQGATSQLNIYVSWYSVHQLFWKKIKSYGRKNNN